jgi:hypothetical protein
VDGTTTLRPGVFANQFSNACECVAPNCPAEAVDHENNRYVKLTTCHLTHFGCIVNNLINTTKQKLKVMYSTIGLQPFIAEPTAIPVNPSSAIGLSITLFSQTRQAFL